MSHALKFTTVGQPTPRILLAPTNISFKEISVIIPVWNNSAGIHKLLIEINKKIPREQWPQEIIVVDDGSFPALHLDIVHLSIKNLVRIIKIPRSGPAHARNIGARCSSGNWLLFTDSDCVPSSTFLSGYIDLLDGSLAYAGNIFSLGNDLLSKYYESQRILIPPPTEFSRPKYLVTANALVWRQAFELIGGFDETYPIAGGEDIDLAFRLLELGNLNYAPHSIVYHNFNDGVFGFVKRFIRYGRGNKLVAQKHGLSFKPRPFKPIKPTPFNWAAALGQYLAMMIGFYTNKT